MRLIRNKIYQHKLLGTTYYRRIILIRNKQVVYEDATVENPSMLVVPIWRFCKQYKLVPDLKAKLIGKNK